MIPIPNINYVSILVIIGCMTFFAVGARMEGRSPFVWGALSFGVWLAYTFWFETGIGGGLVSQALLFVALGCYGVIKDRRSGKPSDLGR